MNGRANCKAPAGIATKEHKDRKGDKIMGGKIMGQEERFAVLKGGAAGGPGGRRPWRAAALAGGVLADGHQF